MSRYIDADNLHNAKFQSISGYGENVAYRVGWNDAIDAICENEPTIEIVRCKDCKHWNGDGVFTVNGLGEEEQLCRWWSKFGTIRTAENGFCSYGERREQ